MDTLTNYITERIRIDNVKQVRFPVDGTVNDMVEFLKMNDFEEIEENLSKSVVDQFNNKKTRGFMMNENILWFADTSKNQISNDNPVFLYNIEVDCFKFIFPGGKVPWNVINMNLRRN